MMRQRVSLVVAALLCIAEAASAQDPLGWNSERALHLMDRARVRRELPRGDSSLQNYQAKASGYVYFYLDRRETDERTLVKVDQIALDLFWKRPNITKQVIVGMRDVNRLPNRMYYHLDHLTVVQNGLGDVIKIGDGDEVRDVPHPAAPGADSVYDYRLADSVTLQLGGGQPEVRVYEINVRPKRTNRSALIGSVYVDRASADIVRMTFTFTPASYVDRRLDYINISLDNGLFGGKYWLPHEQSVEIRRQIPELDFVAGAVIKGRLRVANYTFNDTIPDSVFFGRPVSAAPEAEREQYPFEQDIYAGIKEEGLAPPPQMAELRARAAALVREQRLSGLPPWRLYVPSASAVLRHNRAEGWRAGLGVSYVPAPVIRFDALGGYAFGPNRPSALLSVRGQRRDYAIALRGYYNEARDIGPIAGMPGVLNTFASGFGDDDYTDTYFARGATLDVAAPRSSTTWGTGLSLAVERHASALQPFEYRTALGVRNGTAASGSIRIERTLSERGPLGWTGSASLGYTRFTSSGDDARHFARAGAAAVIRLSSEDTRTTFITAFDAGANVGPSIPPQYAFLLGGRETLPGYDYREFESKAFGLVRTELARTVASPWLRARVLGSAAFMHGGPASTNDIIPEDGGRVRASAGIGVGLLWDAIRIDLSKGRSWQTVVSIRRDFWDLL